MNFAEILLTVISFGSFFSQPPAYAYNFSWHTRGPAIVQEQARGSWTIDKQLNAQAPVKIANDSLGVDLTAKSAVVIDKASGAVLWEKNKDEVRAIGSITKLMTALVLLENNPGWEQTFELTAQDRTNGGLQHLLYSDPIKLRDIMAVALIASDNSSAMVLARASGLSQEDFVAAMNSKAKDLGLQHTSFSDPTGLSPDNVSTAEEVIKLATEAFKYPDIRNFANQDKYNFKSVGGHDYAVKSTNKLLKSFINIAAAKTGFINKAGYCIVAEVEDNGQTILAAILGSETDADRFQDLKMLSYWVSKNFKW